MKKAVICAVCILFIYVLVNFYNVCNLSTQFDELEKDAIDKMGIIDNGGAERLFYNGTMEFETIRNKLFDLLNELHETAPILKRGESKKAGIMTIYNNKNILFKIYFGYSPINNIIRLEIHDGRNYTIERNFYINTQGGNSFFLLFECSQGLPDFLCQ
jgi:hypothetical protein